MIDRCLHLLPDPSLPNMCLLFPFAPAFPILEKNQLESGTGLAAKKEEEAEGLSNLIGAISPDTSAVTVLSIVHGPPTTPSPALPCPHTHCCRACWFPKTEKPEDFAPWNPVCIVYALWLPGGPGKLKGPVGDLEGGRWVSLRHLPQPSPLPVTSG